MLSVLHTAWSCYRMRLSTCCLRMPGLGLMRWRTTLFPVCSLLRERNIRSKERMAGLEGQVALIMGAGGHERSWPYHSLDAAAQPANGGLLLHETHGKDDTMSVPYAGSSQQFDVEIGSNVMMPTRDGVRLATDLYDPAVHGDRAARDFRSSWNARPTTKCPPETSPTASTLPAGVTSTPSKTCAGDLNRKESGTPLPEKHPMVTTRSNGW
ncbi:hypothetical protein NKDENANG_01251 [Candidatus Entotheonellaceae bacterium PAL068K]